MDEGIRSTGHTIPVDVWLVDQTRLVIAPNDALNDLSSKERSHAASLSHPHIRQSAVLSRWVFKWVLAQYLNVQTHRVELETDSLGKPRLRGTPFHFNLSHSGNFSAVAVCACTPVGIDIEINRAVPDCRDLAGWMMSALEKRIFATFPGNQHNRRFLELWTRKEAVLKCEGVGLMRDPRSILVGWHHLPVQIEGETFHVADIKARENIICAASSRRNFHVNFCTPDERDGYLPLEPV